MNEKEVSLILRIEGGIADEGLLDAYDAANTIYGLARAINLISHAFSNKEEVRKRTRMPTAPKHSSIPQRRAALKNK